MGRIAVLIDDGEPGEEKELVATLARAVDEHEVLGWTEIGEAERAEARKSLSERLPKMATADRDEAVRQFHARYDPFGSRAWEFRDEIRRLEADEEAAEALNVLMASLPRLSPAERLAGAKEHESRYYQFRLQQRLYERLAQVDPATLQAMRAEKENERRAKAERVRAELDRVERARAKVEPAQTEAERARVERARTEAEPEGALPTGSSLAELLSTPTEMEPPDPTAPISQAPAVPSIAESVVMIAIPAVVGPLAQQVVELAVNWVRERAFRHGRDQTVKVYGADGEVIRTVRVSSRGVVREH